jgi:uncharacterized protein YigE (DUF2233 family)
MVSKDDNGTALGALKNGRAYAERNGKKLMFAMNGGMYTKQQGPQGVYIENGIVKHGVDTVQNAFGNFYLQPNGVFYLTTSGQAHVVPTEYFTITPQVAFATQSGPMLLINGAYHPRLIKGSTNLHIRNAVGILPNGEVLCVMSKQKVNFYDLATLFKQLGCANALYLDGFVSKMYCPQQNNTQLGGNFGVVIAQFE